MLTYKIWWCCSHEEFCITSLFVRKAENTYISETSLLIPLMAHNIYPWMIPRCKFNCNHLQPVVNFMINVIWCPASVQTTQLRSKRDYESSIHTLPSDEPASMLDRGLNTVALRCLGYRFEPADIFDDLLSSLCVVSFLSILVWVKWLIFIHHPVFSYNASIVGLSLYIIETIKLKNTNRKFRVSYINMLK